MLYEAQTYLKRLFSGIWNKISRSAYIDTTVSMNMSAAVSLDIRTSRETKIRLKHKHFSPIVRKVVNDLLAEKRYKVKKIRYRLCGMDVFITKM